MKPVLHASLIAALTSLAVDAHAATERHCVTTLEAQPQKSTASPKKPCPVAVAYTRRAPRIAETAAPTVPGVRA